MKRFYKQTIVLAVLACVLSIISWVVLGRMVESAEIEGPLMFVSGILNMALFFAFPISWVVFGKLRLRFKKIRSTLLASIVTLLICFVVSFAGFALLAFFLTDPIISVLNYF